MIELEHLHHLSFSVPDLEAGLSFWRDTLGFAPIERPDSGVPGAWLSGHGVEVHLLSPAGLPPAEGALSPLRNHVAFRVSDLKAVCERLAAAGLEVLGGPGGRQAWVLDPGANVIEFIQPG